MTRRENCESMARLYQGVSALTHKMMRDAMENGNMIVAKRRQKMARLDFKTAQHYLQMTIDERKRELKQPR